MISRDKSDFIFLLLGRILQIIVVLLSLRLATTLLEKEQLGVVYYFLTIQGFFSLFFINPSGQYFNRQTFNWLNTGKLSKNLLLQILFITIISVIALVFLFLLSVAEKIELDFFMCLFIALLIMALSTNQTVIPLLNMLGYRREFVILNLLTAICSLLFSYLTMLAFGFGYKAWVAGIIVSNLLFSVLAILFYFFKAQVISECLSSNEDSKLFGKEFWKFSIPISFATLFMWYMNTGFRINIKESLGLEYLAYIGVGLAISRQVFSVIESLVTQFLIPKLYRDIEGKEKKERELRFNNYFHLTLPIYISASCFLWVSNHNLLPFVVGEKYLDVSEIINLGVVIEFSRTMTNVLSLVCQIEKKTKLFFSAYIIPAFFLFLALSFHDIDEHSLMCFLTLANVLSLVIMFFLARKMLSVKFPLAKVFVNFLYMIPVVLYFEFVNVDEKIDIHNFIYSTGGGLLYLALMYVYWKKYYKS